MAQQSKPSLPDLQRHLAFEVHYLVWTAKAFTASRSKTKVAFQDSALLHARNLLEFSKPTRPSWAWWIRDFETVPTSDCNYEAWHALVHAKVMHMGDNRITSPPWPVPLDGHECEAVARYCLERVNKIASDVSPARQADRVALSTIIDLVKHGLAYLDSGNERHLKALGSLFTP